MIVIFKPKNRDSEKDPEDHQKIFKQGFPIFISKKREITKV
jgi:hypothetical protein